LKDIHNDTETIAQCKEQIIPLELWSNSESTWNK